ncbi:MAG: hypothetical protein K0R75_1172 [Paenibacillaceae bacterium]|nr:hypothetical protein [Paenibacillaceae bacterium]
MELVDVGLVELGDEGQWKWLRRVPLHYSVVVAAMAEHVVTATMAA